jgi:peptide-methionine (S)-S-oxide reductase
MTLSDSSRILAGAFLSLVLLFTGSFIHAEEAPRVLPAPALDNPKAAGPMQTAILAGGCFWGIHGVYQHVTGVKQVLSGYSGGAKEDANYERVSRGTTKHAEAVEIVFDPAVISYGEILRIFFSVAHDPTELNRQGPDIGAHYRTNIFYADAQQKKIASAYIAQLDAAKSFSKPIVTRVDPLTAFCKAEAYHQDYLLKNPDSGYIIRFDLPKIEALKRLMPHVYRAEPVRVAAAR